MKKLLSLAAGLTLFAGVASAEPVTLSEEAMDGVTAAYGYADAYATGYALALGCFDCDSDTYANVVVDTFALTDGIDSEAGAFSYSVAESD